MRIILLKDIPKLGQAGEIKDVSPNYARNILLRKQEAQLATPDNIKKLEARQALEEKEIVQTAAAMNRLAKQLGRAKLKIKAKANDQGKLFGAVDAKKIAKALKTQKLPIKDNQIKLSEPIKEIGTHNIPYKLGPDIEGSFKLEIQPQ